MIRFCKNIKKFLFPKPKGELYFAIRRILGVAPRNIQLYEQALMHRSMMQRDKQGAPLNNERLEFLGDAILGAVVSDYLYGKYRRKAEGFLTKTRSKLVQRHTLGLLSHRLGLDELIHQSILRGGHNSYIEGNAFEALFGALYLDLGYAPCQRFFQKMVDDGTIQLDQTLRETRDNKSQLLEWAQKMHAEVHFVCTEDHGAARSVEPPFHTRLLIEGLHVSTGHGYTKKESHQKAAARALKSVHYNPHLVPAITRARLLRSVITDMLNEVTRHGR